MGPKESWSQQLIFLTASSSPCIVQRHVCDEDVMRMHQSVVASMKLRGTCKRHALDACSPRDFGSAFPASIFPGLLRRLARTGATAFISPAHGRCTLPSTIHLISPLNVNHVLVGLASDCATPLLWYSHRVLSLLRVYVCHLRVQET